MLTTTITIDRRFANKYTGNGIINVDGELWKVQRKAGLNFLNTSNLRVLTDVALPQYLSQSVAFLKSRANNNVVDLQAIFHEITTQLMGKMAYNVSLGPFQISTGHVKYSSADRMA